MSPRTSRVQQTDNPSRDRFALWLGAVLEGKFTVQLAEGPRIESRVYRNPPRVKQGELADAVPINERVIRSWLSRQKGPSPDVAFSVGEAIATLHYRDWCGGILSVAAIPIYRIHVLRWIAVLLAQNGPTPDLRLMWPLLANLATEKAFVSRPNPLPSFRWTDAQRTLSRKAWSRIGDVGEPLPENCPAIMAAAVALQQAIGHSGDLSTSLADEAMKHALHAWFDGIERNWRSVKSF